MRATAGLVADRGFHAVGIVDIGAAAGVTGSAIYRHFSSKHEMLVAVFDYVLDELLDGARDARDANRPLDELVRRHVDFALRDRDLIKVWATESHNLPAADGRRLRRKQRVYAELWVEQLVATRSDLSRELATAAVHAVFGLVNSIADYEAKVPREELGALLRTSAARVLRAGR